LEGFAGGEAGAGVGGEKGEYSPGLPFVGISVRQRGSKQEYEVNNEIFPYCC
jgi:hypothetical protein